MSLNQILDELPQLTPQERLRVAEKALALDELSASDQAIVDQRLAEHDHLPETAKGLDDFLVELRTQYSV
jgi:hypothetical protein